MLDSINAATGRQKKTTFWTRCQIMTVVKLSLTVLKQSNEVTKIVYVCACFKEVSYKNSINYIFNKDIWFHSQFETFKQKDNHGPTHTLLSGLILIIHIHYIYMRLCGIRLLFCGFLLQPLSSTMFLSARACVRASVRTSERAYLRNKQHTPQVVQKWKVV